jgi:16S rRNA pseudouridine516 synthase
MAKKTSLLQYLMRSGKFKTAYDAERAILTGRVNVRKETIRNPKHFFDPKTDFVFVDGELIKKSALLYFLMNKPAGIICQKSKEEESIFDLLTSLPLTPEQRSSLFVIGRLDKDTEGLLILTNDGKLSDALMNPKHEVPKTYYAILNLPLTHIQKTRLESGVTIKSEEGEYTTKPCVIKKESERTIFISITEGKKRQIRKMLEAIGNEVIHLKRVSIGKLELGSLQLGEIRKVSKEDVLKALIDTPSVKKLH